MSAAPTYIEEKYQPKNYHPEYVCRVCVCSSILVGNHVVLLSTLLIATLMSIAASIGKHDHVSVWAGICKEWRRPSKNRDTQQCWAEHQTRSNIFQTCRSRPDLVQSCCADLRDTYRHDVRWPSRRPQLDARSRDRDLEIIFPAPSMSTDIPAAALSEGPVGNRSGRKR